MKNTKTIISLTVLMGLFALSACNTMEGAGQDISAGGKKLENSADKHKNY